MLVVPLAARTVAGYVRAVCVRYTLNDEANVL